MTVYNIPNIISYVFRNLYLIGYTTLKNNTIKSRKIIVQRSSTRLSNPINLNALLYNKRHVRDCVYNAPPWGVLYLNKISINYNIIILNYNNIIIIQPMCTIFPCLLFLFICVYLCILYMYLPQWEFKF